MESKPSRQPAKEPFWWRALAGLLAFIVGWNLYWGLNAFLSGKILPWIDNDDSPGMTVWFLAYAVIGSVSLGIAAGAYRWIMTTLVKNRNAEQAVGGDA